MCTRKRYEAVVHPKVMKKVKADDEYKRAIVEIGLTSVEARAKEQKTPGAKLDRAKMKVKEKPLKCRLVLLNFPASVPT